MAAKPRYAVELKADVDEASFQAGDDNVTLTADKRVWETTDRSLYYGVRDLPFLKDLGEQKASSSKSGADS